MRSILVAIRDPGQHRQPLIRRARQLAAGNGTRLTLFHAFSLPVLLSAPVPANPVAILDAVARQRRIQLESLARPLRARGIEVDCETVWDFPVAQAIVRQVLKDKPDLVLAESHRRARVSRWFLTNTDWELIRECPCPVWFVRRERFAKKPLVLAAIDPTHAHAKPSGLDERLAEAAHTVAGRLAGRPGLLHITDTTPYVTAGVMALPLRLAARRQAAESPVRAAIHRLAAHHDIPESACVTASGIPAVEISRSVRQLSADVLVMGAISRSGLKPSFIGSTAEAVIDEVECDLLIVKPRRFRTTVTRRRPRLATP